MYIDIYVYVLHLPFIIEVVSKSDYKLFIQFYKLAHEPYVVLPSLSWSFSNYLDWWLMAGLLPFL